MSAAQLYVDVIGDPAPQGSKRHVGGGRLVESSKRVGPWRETVAAHTAREAQEQGWECATGPVMVTLTFWLPRPASAPRRRIWPDRKPDLDKLIRSTMDALTMAGAIEDDARVVVLTAAKRYATDGHWTGVSIDLEPVTAVPIQVGHDALEQLLGRGLADRTIIDAELPGIRP